MPARFFLAFFHNHGFLSTRRQVPWRVVEGGSRRYVDALASDLGERVRAGVAVTGIARARDHVEIKVADGSLHRVDQVVLACHSDQSLGLLADASDGERAMLEGIPYQVNEAVLHTDERLLPRTRRAWAAWNYHVPARPSDAVAVTYNMNLLQGIEAPVTFCVTLNRSDQIDPRRVLRRMRWAHPVFGAAASAAQRARRDLNGHNRTWYAGAWSGFGFHEDGVESARSVTRRFGVDL